MPPNIVIDHRLVWAGEDLTARIEKSPARSFIAVACPHGAQSLRNHVARQVLHSGSWNRHAVDFWGLHVGTPLTDRGWVVCDDRLHQLRSDFFDPRSFTPSRRTHELVSTGDPSVGVRVHWYLDLAHLPGENFESAAKFLHERYPPPPQHKHILHPYNPIPPT